MVLILFWTLETLLIVMSWCFISPLWGLKSHSASRHKAFLSWALGLSLFSAGLYFKIGYSAQMAAYYQRSSLLERAEMRDLQVLLNDLKRQEYVLRLKLLEDPDNDSHWLSLANLYMAQQAPEKALNALENARKLRPEDRELQINCLVISAKLKKGQLDSGERLAAEALLQDNSENMFLLNLLAVDSFQRQAFEDAVHFWQSAQKTLDRAQHPESYHLLDRLIEDAQAQSPPQR